MARSVYKVYLAERDDGRCYIGCTKNSPRDRVRETYHPLRWRGPNEKACPSTQIQTSVMFYTTDVTEAAKYETAMIAEFRTLEPRGANTRAESGYAGNLLARQRRAEA